MSEIKISDYTYFLPQDRIALHPLADRDRSKLLVYDKGAITHSTFSNFPSYIPQDATLYFNNSKVIQARLHFTKDSGASIEVFLLNPVLPSSLLLQVMQSTERCSWSCTIGNLKRWKEGTALKKNVGAIVLQAMLKDKEHGTVEFTWTTGKTFAEVIESAGETPLPPYLKREPVPEDKERYQTVYSRIEGAVAAPTAGLHFTAPVFQELERRNIRTQFLTLHVSAGTFLPVKTEIATQHTMHQEQMVVTRENILALRDDVFTVAVGTTSMRTIESLYWFGAKLQDDDSAGFQISQSDPYSITAAISKSEALENVLGYMRRHNMDTLVGETSIYIMPGYDFKICRGLVTNFHQPGSTLMLLVAAFIGNEWRKVYDEALQKDYRFLSYGDSSFLIPQLKG